MLMKEEVPEEVIHNELIADVNKNPIVFNNTLLYFLGCLNDVITELTEEDKLLATSKIDYILTAELIATNLLKILEVKSDSIKATDSLKDMLIINSKSILNAVNIISDLQKKKLINATPEEIIQSLIK